MRVTQCLAVLRAEDVYTSLLRDKPDMKAGGHGNLSFTIAGRSHTAEWELSQNAVWKHGRVFFRCPQCSRRATRLYVPVATSWLACRRCWGLTYSSRQTANYKDSGPLAGIGITHRLTAQMLTDGERERRAEAAAKRYTDRRAILARAARAVGR